MQEKIDSLDIITEAFVRELNMRSIEKQTGHKMEKTLSTKAGSEEDDETFSGKRVGRVHE